MALIDQFQAEIDSYLEATNMSPTRFGVAVLKDPVFVFAIRSGKRSPTLKTIERVRAWMAENPPSEAAA